MDIIESSNAGVCNVFSPEPDEYRWKKLTLQGGTQDISFDAGSMHEVIIVCKEYAVQVYLQFVTTPSAGKVWATAGFKGSSDSVISPLEIHYDSDNIPGAVLTDASFVPANGIADMLVSGDVAHKLALDTSVVRCVMYRKI